MAIPHDLPQMGDENYPQMVFVYGILVNSLPHSRKFLTARKHKRNQEASLHIYRDPNTMRCSSLKPTVTINRLGVTLIKSNAIVEKRPCKTYCGHV